MTYDLRRLRVHGLIQRAPHSHRYYVANTGLPTALFLARVHPPPQRDRWSVRAH